MGEVVLIDQEQVIERDSAGSCRVISLLLEERLLSWKGNLDSVPQHLPQGVNQTCKEAAWLWSVEIKRAEHIDA